MTPLILHLIGDYVTQSDWMAQNKTKSTWAAFCHATVYSLPFLTIASWPAWWVIWSTHLLIDRFRLARYVCYFKNQVLSPGGICWALDLPKYPSIDSIADYVEEKTDVVPEFNYQIQPWSECSGTGYHKDSPPWMAVWLMIAADNTLHLAINHLALSYL